MSGTSNIIPSPFRGVTNIPGGNIPVGQNSNAVVGIPLDVLINVGFVNATTTDTNDSIKITGALGALAANNPAYVVLMSTSTAGRKVVLQATADVTIKLTGAHWNQDTKGDLTDSFLRVYAINDNGTLKWGVGYVGARASVVNTDTDTNPANITQPEMLLVNSALSAGTWPCLEIGYFYATFDDTGGAHENLWAVQTSTTSFNIGKIPNGIFQTFGTVITGFTGGSPAYSVLKWCQNDKQITVVGIRSGSATSNATTFTIELPVKAAFIVNMDVTDQQDNGAGINNHGILASRAGSVTADLYKNSVKAAWTNVNAKCASFTGTYPAN